ncbi:MAG: ABC transporter ATP-binding protein/permease [Candidatus Omnitrophica bacterium]|nr:ABC transporter ATP-binding protein/permease [Candidatus Omnitrophota bacterium]
MKNFQFYRYILQYKGKLLFLLIINLISLIFTLSLPYVTKFIIDKAYKNKNIKLFVVSVVIGIIIFLVSTILNFIGKNISTLFKKQVIFDITTNLFRHLQQLPLSFYDQHSSGVFVQRLNNDVRRLSEFLVEIPVGLVVNLIGLVIIFVILFYLDLRIALVCLVAAPLNFIYPYFSGYKLKMFLEKEMTKVQNISKLLVDVFVQMRLVKAFNNEEIEIERFEKNFAERIHLEKKIGKISNFFDLSSSFISKVISSILTLYCGYLVMKKRLSLGNFSAIVLYINHAVAKVKGIADIVKNISENSVLQTRIRNIFDIEPPIYKDLNYYGIKQAKIEFKDVVFGYNSSKLIFNGISFVIEPLSKIALIGPSGCGKSTILSLILRLYEIQKGSILIDGVDIRDIGVGSLREQIGIALQQPLLRDETIAFNILYGKKDATKEEMIWASKIACAYDFIMELKDCFDTFVGERGVRLSEGQKQRIALARAIIKNPKILILDEAISSVDLETEEKIIENIKNNLLGSTVIIVSHRLSVIKKMDLIYFLESPKKIEVGTHQKLLLENQKYKNFLSSKNKV